MQSTNGSGIRDWEQYTPCTDRCTEFYAGLNESKDYALIYSFIAHTAGAFSTPVATTIDAFIHVLIFVVIGTIGIVPTGYNHVYVPISGAAKWREDLELNSALVHLKQAVNLLFLTTIVWIQMCLDPSQVHKDIRRSFPDDQKLKDTTKELDQNKQEVPRLEGEIEQLKNQLSTQQSTQNTNESDLGNQFILAQRELKEARKQRDDALKKSQSAPKTKPSNNKTLQQKENEFRQTRLRLSKQMRALKKEIKNLNNKLKNTNSLLTDEKDFTNDLLGENNTFQDKLHRLQDKLYKKTQTIKSDNKINTQLQDQNDQLIAQKEALQYMQSKLIQDNLQSNYNRLLQSKKNPQISPNTKNQQANGTSQTLEFFDLPKLVESCKQGKPLQLSDEEKQTIKSKREDYSQFQKTLNQIHSSITWLRKNFHPKATPQATSHNPRATRVRTAPTIEIQVDLPKEPEERKKVISSLQQYFKDVCEVIGENQVDSSNTTLRSLQNSMKGLERIAERKTETSG